MPLGTIASYLSTTDAFLTHWTQWNNVTAANNATGGALTTLGPDGSRLGIICA